MALMAVMLLIAVVLIQQKDREHEAQIELKQAEADARAQEAEALRDFADDLLDALESAQGVQFQQEQVGEWVESLFKQAECALHYDPKSGKLTPGHDEQASAAQLYDPGSVELSDDAIRELESCRKAFAALAACLSDNESVRTALCPASSAEADHEEAIDAFRRDIEALVLQGNTDRTLYYNAGRIAGMRGRRLDAFPKAFTANAQLGAERARQALGHLMLLIQEEVGSSTGADDEDSALQVFASRARIESPSFGRYQAGPMSARLGECGDEESCEEARNLSLELRFRQASLRRPFRNVSLAFCKEWWKEGQLRESVGSDDERAKKLCEPLLCGDSAEDEDTASIREVFESNEKWESARENAKCGRQGGAQ